MNAPTQVRQKILEVAVNDSQSPIHSATLDETEFKDRKIFLRSTPAKSEHYTAVLARRGNQPLEATSEIKPQLDPKKSSCHSFGAVFVEVAIDPGPRSRENSPGVAMYDVGKIMNEKLAKSQFIGGIVWGISLALLEDTNVDSRNGRIMNANLADYHVPVNADIGEIDISAIDVPDLQLDSLGARGIGEIGITGTGAAVANAIFHATGKRIRELPITPDKLL
jgi:xanthine dehydrogenase YagR molybdenum-binding subunit